MTNILARLFRRITQVVMRPILDRRMKQLGISFQPPNYVYLNRFDSSSIVADVGCGYEAEFSRHMIERHAVSAYGVDPTRKHAPFLQKVVRESGGRFTHLPLAVTRQTGTIVFHESRDHESGSVLSTHTNVLHDETQAYEVDSVSLLELTTRVGASRVAFLKLDLEGAEYELLQDVTATALTPFDQIFVEFHHHCTKHTVRETQQIVDRLRGAGFESFTLDAHNYLFYRERTIAGRSAVG